MKVEFRLNEGDYINYLMFTASKSPRVKKLRMTIRILMLVVFAGLSAFYLFNNYLFAGFGVIAIGVLWAFLYPHRQRKVYEKHYRAHIAEAYGARLGKLITTEIVDENIISSDNGGETKQKLTEIERIDEIGVAIYLKTKSGYSFILPKEQIENVDDVRSELQEIATRLNIQYFRNEGWRWK